MAEPLRKQAAQVGMDQAQRWIALCDAGSGLEDLLRVNFPRVEAVILDFYHATEYLGDLGRALYPGDEPAREEWIERWCHRLKHEGGQVVLEALRGLDLGGPRVGPAGPWRGDQVLREPGASDGLPELPGQGVGDRLRPGGIGVQDGHRQADEGGRDAVGRGRGR